MPTVQNGSMMSLKEIQSGEAVDPGTNKSIKFEMAPNGLSLSSVVEDTENERKRTYTIDLGNAQVVVNVVDESTAKKEEEGKPAPSKTTSTSTASTTSSSTSPTSSGTATKK